jgi:circadian clock protein KaiC
MYLIEGTPGTGKTTLGLQFLLAGVAQGERVMYVTLSQSPSELEQIAASHGWSLDGVDVASFDHEFERMPEETEHTLFHSADVDLNETIRRIRTHVDETRPDRVVFDSAAEIRLLASDPLRSRRQFLTLKYFFAKRDATVLVLDDESAPGDASAIHSIMHGVIRLEQHAPSYGRLYRRLRFMKLRGLPHPSGYHDFRIGTGGLELFPGLDLADTPDGYDAQSPDNTVETLESGVPGLDAMLGGGFDFGSSVAVLGVSGTGKSSLATCYALAALEQGVKAAIYTFDEREETLLLRSKGLGMDLHPHLRSGALTLQELSPADVSSGEFTHRIRSQVEENGVRVLVLDSLTGYIATVPEERRAATQLHDLLSLLGDYGVLTFLTVPQHGLLGLDVDSQLDVSYLADSVVMLRHYEALGSLSKAISVVKRRRGDHEHNIRRFLMSDEGIRVGDCIKEYQGVLTGVPAIGGNNHDGHGKNQ